MMHLFDRNNFKSFAESNRSVEKQSCSQNHSEMVKHKTFGSEWKSSFRAVSDTELTNYLFVGSLRDPQIKMLDYMECNDKPGDFWNANTPIATNFYPYHDCDVYQCRDCHRLFLVYTEHGGHFPEQRMRNVKPELILEEPSNCSLKIPEENIPALLDILEINADEFEEMLEQNKDLSRIDSNFGIEKTAVKRKYEDTFLIVAKRDTIYRLIAEL